MSGTSIIDGDYNLSAHFKLRELWCPCCHGYKLTNLRQLCIQLELVRSDFGPIEISSGYRCQMHNLEVNGARFSRHMEGKAADVKALTDGDRFRLVLLMMKYGFKRIGIAKSIIHADIDVSRVPVMWTYYP